MNSGRSDSHTLKEVSELPGLPIFFNAWWLDIVCSGNNWEYAISRDKEGKINGVLPIMYEKKFGFNISRMPSLTPFLGPWIAPFKGEKNHARISHYQKIMGNLIDKMPPLSFFSQKFSPLIENWYSFYQHGYEQTTHYTFILHNINDVKFIWDGLKNTVRTLIRNSENEIRISYVQNADQLYGLQEKTFKKQNLEVPFSRKMLSDLVEGINAQDAGTIVLALDKQDKLVAGSLIVWDNSMAYLLLLGMEEENPQNGAIQKVIWESIQKAAKRVTTFNFEGTMLSNVEPVFRHFGGNKVAYSIVKKDGNKFIKLCRIAAGK
jgi:hypothetical protein